MRWLSPPRELSQANFRKTFHKTFHTGANPLPGSTQLSALLIQRMHRVLDRVQTTGIKLMTQSSLMRILATMSPAALSQRLPLMMTQQSLLR